MNDTRKILRIDGSAQTSGSITRQLSNYLIDALPHTDVVVRDLANGLPLINETWVGANFTPDSEKSQAQKDTLALSDELIAELTTADTLVIGLPAYNFGVPAAVKAWVDLVSRAQVTFRYTENGPEGLLKGKKAYIVFASGGTPVGSDYDFATTYMKHLLAFLGITDTIVIAADQTAVDAEGAVKAARGHIDEITRNTNDG